MKNLLILEIRKYLKDKFFIVSIILCAALTLLTLIGYILVKIIIRDLIPISGFTIFQVLISPTGIIALVSIIAGLIIMSNDYTYGTLRGKLVAGYSRTKIYFSSYIIFICFVMSMTIIFSLFGYALGSMFLGNKSLTSNDFLSTLGLNFLWLIFITTFVFFIFSNKKNFLVPLITLLIIIYAFPTIISIIQYSTASSPSFKTINNILFYIPFYQSGTLNSTVQTIIGLVVSKSYSTYEIVVIVLTNILYSIGLLYGGLLLYKKSDIR